MPLAIVPMASIICRWRSDASATRRSSTSRTFAKALSTLSRSASKSSMGLLR